MMKFEDKLKKEVGTDAGFRVPDGYFDEIFDKISASLPERKPVAVPKMTTWQRVRPYVYLAAMFAGIWCMMKMFHLMTTSPEVSLDNPPALVAEAIADPDNNEEIASMVSVPTEKVLESELESSYDSFDDFEEDFDYQFEEEYADINLDELASELNIDDI